jgi:very-short-patch-repair endonuclease
MTDCEILVWQHLRRAQCAGYTFRRQQVISGFVVDFYCPRKRLVVEIDGPIDNARTNVLLSLSLRVLRFTNEEVTSDIERVLAAIRQSLTT